MDPGIFRDALVLALGLFTGVMSAAFGVGGAIVSTPGIRALGVTPLLAIGSTLPAILPGAVTGTLRYSRAGLVDWAAVRWCVPAGIVTSVAGSLLADEVPGDGHWLMVLTAVLLGFTAWRLARTPTAGGPAPSPAAEAIETETEVADAALVGLDVAHPRMHPPGLRLALVGAVSGAFSGLLGVGGGFLMVPAFSEYIGMPLKAGIATSLACVSFFAVPGIITHAIEGNIDWRVALLLAAMVVPGARLGAWATLRSSDARLRLSVGFFLGAVATAFAIGEALSL